MSSIGDDVRRHLLDDGSVIIEKRGMRGVVDKASEFTRDGITGKKNAGLEGLDLKPALPLTFVSLPGPIASA
nr:hypothetical protein [Rhodoplanes sp. Z2-YC6860]